MNSTREEYSSASKNQLKVNTKIGCEAITCFGCLGLVVLIILLVVLRPKAVLDESKSFLNGELGNDVPQYSESNFDLSSSIVNDEIRISESDLVHLIGLSNQKVSIERIEIEENKITLMDNIAQEGNPLWLTFTIEEKDQAFVIERIGFGRIPFPKSIINKMLQRFFEASTDNFISILLNKTDNPEFAAIIKPENVEIEKDIIIISVVPSEFDFLPEDVDQYIKNLNKDYLDSK